MSARSYKGRGPAGLRDQAGLRHAADPREQGAARATAALRGMPRDEVLYEVADFFKIFGDSTRIRMLYALHRSELCVQDLASGLGMGQSAVSHQLRVLKSSGLVRHRREGRRAFYALDDEHIAGIITQGLAHVKERR